MKIGISGITSTIAVEVADIIGEEVCAICHLADMPLNLDRYLICTGYLAGKEIGKISSDALMETFTRNFAEIARFCDHILANRPRARICIIGSESGIAGSFDMAYAGAKAAMHLYIETKQLQHPAQMIIGIAPHIIWNSNMTAGRPDYADLLLRGQKTRLGRWLDVKEVAALAAFLLMEASPSLSGQVIRMRCS